MHLFLVWVLKIPLISSILNKIDKNSVFIFIGFIIFIIIIMFENTFNNEIKIILKYLRIRKDKKYIIKSLFNKNLIWFIKIKKYAPTGIRNLDPDSVNVMS